MRIKQLQKQLKINKIDLALFWCDGEKKNTNIEYFSNYSGIGYLIVTKSNSFLLIPEYKQDKTKNSTVKFFIAEKKKYLIDQLAQKISKLKIKKTAIEEDKITVYRYKQIKKRIKGRFTNISKICSSIRMIKDSNEITYLKKACEVTDNVFSKVVKKFKTFKYEDDVRNFIETEFTKQHCELSFPTIAASNTGTSFVHYERNKKIQKGFFMLDFGAKYKGYHADMTRMIYFGNPKKKELEDYELMLKTITECESTVNCKKTFGDIDKLSKKILSKKNYECPHMLGHGVGLDIHERPSVYSEDKTKIQNNIVFTIEPGIYFPDKYGIRIEDTVMIQNNKLVTLTKSNKKLTIIK
jgi:Xaa-Pro aminopeptidase